MYITHSRVIQGNTYSYCQVNTFTFFFCKIIEITVLLKTFVNPISCLVMFALNYGKINS